jgi:hypothetical protein
MLSIPHCLDNLLTDGGEVVRLTRRPLSTLSISPPPRVLVLISVRVSVTIWPGAAGRIR